jgi:hypothetical protein
MKPKTKLKLLKANYKIISEMAECFTPTSKHRALVMMNSKMKSILTDIEQTKHEKRNG